MRPFGPKLPGEASPHPCPACRKEFVEGDYSTLVAFGPGDDPEAQERCREGRPYNAVAAEVHWACATGHVTPGAKP